MNRPGSPLLPVPSIARRSAAGLATAAILLLAGCASAPVAISPGNDAATPSQTASPTGTARPAEETIPSAAVLDVTPVFPLTQQGASSTGPALAVTDAAQIAKITGLINALPVTQQGLYCPNDDGAGLQMVFRTATGSEIATVDADATGCGKVAVTIGGASEPGLSGGSQLDTQIEAILGQHWQLSR
jgi:hypothetical protein